MNFKIALRLRDWHVSDSVEILNNFSTLSLKQFLENENLFQKTGVAFFRLKQLD